MPVRKNVDLGKGGCLCWDKSTYSPDCCDPDDPYAEGIGQTRGEREDEPEQEPES